MCGKIRIARSCLYRLGGGYVPAIHPPSRPFGRVSSRNGRIENRTCDGLKFLKKKNEDLRKRIREAHFSSKSSNPYFQYFNTNTKLRENGLFQISNYPQTDELTPR